MGEVSHAVAVNEYCNTQDFAVFTGVRKKWFAPQHTLHEMFWTPLNYKKTQENARPSDPTVGLCLGA